MEYVGDDSRDTSRTEDDHTDVEAESEVGEREDEPPVDVRGEGDPLETRRQRKEGLGEG